ncbi:MAG: 5'/3'-nucleotidase SurE [Haloquadratum sp.]|jgi:5'-nucleotidase|nr:5'/3'-nucleotidase SurE [Haloferacaceae archaeon]MDR9444779.1 5'/3'-nucleotidase SurE [Haloquadratum sp.]
MTHRQRVLLTNDDGVDAVGIRAMYQMLAQTCDVTVVAPATDQSSVGRQLSWDLEVSQHQWGYEVDGTPADCVVAGVELLCPEVDAVVAGCNKGANLGAYVLGRSGTVSAAVEAAFFEVPAMAVSMYVPGGGETPWQEQAVDPAVFVEATSTARFLLERPLEELVPTGGYLNINAPIASDPGRPTAAMEVTEPSTWYAMTAQSAGDREVRLHDAVWEQMRTGEIPDPAGTDRRAVMEGRVSVSPLSAPHTPEDPDRVASAIDAYDPG